MNHPIHPLERAPIRQRRFLRELRGKLRGNRCVRRKTRLFRPAECHAPVASVVHVCPHDHPRRRLHIDRPATPCKRLLIHMAVRQNPPVKKLAVRRDDFPPIGVPIASGQNKAKTTGRACPAVTKSPSGATCSKVTAPELWLSAQEAVDLYAASKRISKLPKPLPHLATGCSPLRPLHA